MQSSLGQATSSQVRESHRAVKDIRGRLTLATGRVWRVESLHGPPAALSTFLAPHAARGLQGLRQGRHGRVGGSTPRVDGGEGRSRLRTAAHAGPEPGQARQDPGDRAEGPQLPAGRIWVGRSRPPAAGDSQAGATVAGAGGGIRNPNLVLLLAPSQRQHCPVQLLVGDEGLRGLRNPKGLGGLREHQHLSVTPWF